MTREDIAQLTSLLGPLIKTHVAAVIATLETRNKDLELRLLELETRPAPVPDRGEPGQKGESGIGITNLMVNADRRLIGLFTDGKSVDAGPIPQGPPGERGEMGPAGKDAPAVDVEAVVVAVLARLPAPAQGLKGETGPPGKDAPAVDVDALVLRVAALVPVPKDGRDGLPGRDGQDVDLQHIKGVIASELATWPRPKDGRDGVDGLGFDDWDLKVDPARGVVLEMRQGDRVKEFVTPQPFVVPKWTPGVVVPKGASVQWDGGYWMALEKTAASPAENHAEWFLLVRRGKQGKEGRAGKDAPALRTSNTPPLYGG